MVVLLPLLLLLPLLPQCLVGWLQSAALWMGRLPNEGLWWWVRQRLAQCC